MFKILTKTNVALNAEIGQESPISRSHWPNDRRMLLGQWRPILHWIIYLKGTIFNQYSRKYMKSIHQLIGHVYSLVPIAVADHRLVRQIIAW